MLDGQHKILFEHLAGKIDKNRIFHDPLHTLAYGTDASFYRLIPRMVIRANNEDEVSLILKLCTQLKIPVTFRAAGTSLSGQAISDSVLVIAGSYWNKYSISENGSEITLQPGLTGGRVNQLLLRYGRKIGPDPASINSAMIGGIASNNASGMCCGTSENSYKTVNGMRILFSDGTSLDTKDNSSRERFKLSHDRLITELSALAKSVKDNAPLAQKIKEKYKIKNTTGYSLNALIDYSDPFEIIEHLMIGAEGTLGFIAGINYRTVIDKPYKASALMNFPDTETACKAVLLLKSSPVSAVELIDRAGLRSVENETGMPDFLRKLNENVCTLLVETVAESKADLFANIEKIKLVISEIPTEMPVRFTDIKAEYEQLWKIRKGLFPSVGAMRKTGTTVIIEDVAFPVPVLAKAMRDLQNLLMKFGYNEAVIFGHALEGNLHFVFNQDFGKEEEISRYGSFMAELSELVVNKYDGSLKAEHGTGRNIAPFVELEWGTEAFRLMKEIKSIFDPLNILNPGVILNQDKESHLKNMKPIPAASELIDKCTECGFCEPSCVSADMTLTPRQRIVIFREMASLARSGHEPHIAASLAKSFNYEGNETCAADGLCSLECPVKIDTGKLIKKLRSEAIPPGEKKALWIADHMSLITSIGRASLSVINGFHILLGSSVMKRVSGGIRKISGNRIPAWNRYMPKGSLKLKIADKLKSNNPKVVYFPSCINRTMGVSQDYSDDVQVSIKMNRLLMKAGYEVIFPENLNNLCCGMAFSSKGYVKAGEKKSAELEAELMKASHNGEYPVLCDMSPCLYTMRENMNHAMKLYEPVEFIMEYLIPRLNIKPLNETITVFPVCSMKKMGLDKKLVDLAKLCAGNVVISETNCCGFAGDRGFTFPELNKHGLRNLRNQIPENVRHGYSNSRTCEIGLSLHSGVSFKSIIYLVDEVSN